VTDPQNVQPPWQSWLGMWSHHLDLMHSRKLLPWFCHANQGSTALSVTLDGFRSLKKRSLCAGDYQPVPSDTCTEVYAAHVSVNIGNYCTQSPKTLQICYQLTMPFQTGSKRHYMSPRHFEIHTLIMCKHILHTVVNRWQPYILLGLLFNERIIFINCHKPKKIPMLH